jgi:hypothetical protein
MPHPHCSLLSAGAVVRAARPDPRAAAAASAAPAAGRQLLGAPKQAPPLKCVIIPGMGILAAEHMLW